MKTIIGFHVILVSLLLIFAGCRKEVANTSSSGGRSTSTASAPTTSAPSVPAVAVDPGYTGALVGCQTVSLYPEDVSNSRQTLSLGQKVQVTSEDRDTFYVTTENGLQGWVYKGALCSAAELKRRQDAGEVPTELLIVTFGEGQFTFVTGPFRPHASPPSIPPGNAIWLHEPARGNVLKIGESSLDGDPSVLYYSKNGTTFVKEPVWK